MNFLIAINYLGEMIKEYFGDGKKFGVNIKYLEENIWELLEHFH